jgi:hypothetical protein
MKVNLARVSQSSLTTGGGVMTGGARGTIVEVALKTDRSMRWATSDPATVPLMFSMY